MTIGKLFALSLSFDDETSATVALLTYVATGKQAGFDGTKLFFEDLWRAAPFDPFTTLPAPGAASGKYAFGADFPSALNHVSRRSTGRQTRSTPVARSKRSSTTSRGLARSRC